MQKPKVTPKQMVLSNGIKLHLHNTQNLLFTSLSALPSTTTIMPAPFQKVRQNFMEFCKTGLLFRKLSKISQKRSSKTKFRALKFYFQHKKEEIFFPGSRTRTLSKDKLTHKEHHIYAKKFLLYDFYSNAKFCNCYRTYSTTMPRMVKIIFQLWDEFCKNCTL